MAVEPRRGPWRVPRRRCRPELFRFAFSNARGCRSPRRLGPTATRSCVRRRRLRQSNRGVGRGEFLGDFVGRSSSVSRSRTRGRVAHPFVRRNLTGGGALASAAAPTAPHRIGGDACSSMAAASSSLVFGRFLLVRSEKNSDRPQRRGSGGRASTEAALLGFIPDGVRSSPLEEDTRYHGKGV